MNLFLSNWQNKSLDERQAILAQFIGDDYTSAKEYDYIRLVEAPHHTGVYASTGTNFRYAIFGRDSLEVGEDLLSTHQALVHDIILMLARYQGTKTDSRSEEEPGKILHEYRHLNFSGTRIPRTSEIILRDLQRWWGDEGSDELVYYGSYDATPLFVRLIHRYVQKYGASLLQETYKNYRGKSYTVQEGVEAAVEWLAQKLETSASGLLEFKKMNLHGLDNQAWKDSQTAYVHTDGSWPNYDRGIASVELQGYAYDALRAACELPSVSAADKTRWQTLAHTVQRATLEKLWMTEKSFFAQGLDYDASGKARQIKTLTSNGAVLLESGLLHDLPAATARPYIEQVVRTIYSSEFITSAGIRCRALEYHDLPGIVDYHGTYTVWPKETYDVAKGLRLSGYAALAHQLEERILYTVAAAGEFYEFFYVGLDGYVWYDRNRALRNFRQLSNGKIVPLPEPGQAWVISAVLGILDWRGRQPLEQLKKPQALEAEILETLPLIERYNPEEQLNDPESLSI